MFGEKRAIECSSANDGAGTVDDEGNKSSRRLGFIVARGTLLVQIAPVDGSEIIDNPFQQQDGDAVALAE